MRLRGAILLALGDDQNRRGLVSAFENLNREVSRRHGHVAADGGDGLTDVTTAFVVMLGFFRRRLMLRDGGRDHRVILRIFATLQCLVAEPCQRDGKLGEQQRGGDEDGAEREHDVENNIRD